MLEDIYEVFVFLCTTGFYNKFYTYSKSEGETVTLAASANDHVSMLISSMLWRFQRIDETTNMPVGDVMELELCSGRLDCTVPSMTRETGASLLKADEGIYEIYRNPFKDPRSWHPIFFLYVRGKFL